MDFFNQSGLALPSGSLVRLTHIVYCLVLQRNEFKVIPKKLQLRVFGVGLIKILPVFKGRVAGLACSKRYTSKRWYVCRRGLYRVSNPNRRKPEIFIKP